MVSKDLGAGLALQSKPDLPLGVEKKHGGASQASRALGVGTYFLSGAMAVNASQFLGAPLYLINRDWYNAWIAFTKQSFGILTTTMTQAWAPTKIRVSGDASVRGQLLQTTDGSLVCDFPERLVLIANHQIYTDWLYLWWIAYTNGMHGRVFIILKESLKRIPVLGWGMQFSQFIFLKRNWEKDKTRLQEHMKQLNDATKPMWLMLFPEGTNLAPSTRKASKKWANRNGLEDMKHTLLPRSTGLQFCLQELKQTTDFVYDCTVAYEGVPRGQYAQDIFTLKAAYLEGRPPKCVNMYWRRFAIREIPIYNDKAFDIWLRARWTEKDLLIERYLRTGHFPADDGVTVTPTGNYLRGAGHILTDIKANRWYEFMQVFAPIGLLCMVLYVFYGALPKRIWNSIKKQQVLGDANKVDEQGHLQGVDEKLLTDRLPRTQTKGDAKNFLLKQLPNVNINGIPSGQVIEQIQKVNFTSLAKKIVMPSGAQPSADRQKLLMDSAATAAYKEIPGLSNASAAQRAMVIQGAAEKAMSVAGSDWTPSKPAATPRKAMSDAGSRRVTTPKKAMSDAGFQQRLETRSNAGSLKAVSEGGPDRRPAAKASKGKKPAVTQKPATAQKPTAPQVNAAAKKPVTTNGVAQHAPAKVTATSKPAPKKVPTTSSAPNGVKKAPQQPSNVKQTAAQAAPTTAVKAPSRVATAAPKTAVNRQAGPPPSMPPTKSLAAPTANKAAAKPPSKAAPAKPAAKSTPASAPNGVPSRSLATKQAPSAPSKPASTSKASTVPKKTNPSSTSTPQAPRPPPSMAGTEVSEATKKAATKRATALAATPRKARRMGAAT